MCHVFAAQPLSRFYHAAALIKDTMVIVGGRTEAEDYSNSVSLYQINCNTWIQPGISLSYFEDSGSANLALPSHLKFLSKKKNAQLLQSETR